jgi:ATP-dependent RNA helicase DeaD
MVDISNIRYCILDEADEMLNMGFYEDITNILSFTPENKNTWLFSATMPQEVSTIAKRFMKTPVEITIGSKNTSAKNIEHEFYVIQGRDRYIALKRLADVNPDIFSLVFCRTKRDTQQVAEKLIEDGYSAAALHGDLSQSQRDTVMKSFRGKQIQMLVATDVAARGIDVDDITHVINYQLPDEIETYTHRSGRTGRAGKSGVSMVIIAKSEIRKIKTIERIIKQTFKQKDIPTGIEICEVQLLHLANKIKQTQINHEIDRYLPTLQDLFIDDSKDELIKKFFSVEFTRFFEYYKKSKDINTQIDTFKDYNESSSGSGASVRYFINLGDRDGFDWMQLKDFLREVLELGRDDVYKVDVKYSFSFFNVDASHAGKVVAFFENFAFKGRRVHIELSQNESKGRFSGGGRGESRGKSFSEGRRSKDFKKPSFGNNFDPAKKKDFGKKEKWSKKKY